MEKSPAEVLDQVLRECARARDGVTRAESVLGIALFDLTKVIRKAEDQGELFPVQKRLASAVEVARNLLTEITAVESAVESAR